MLIPFTLLTPIIPLTTTSSSTDFQPFALLALSSIGSPLTFPIIISLLTSTHTHLPPALSPMVFIRVLFLDLSFFNIYSSPCSKSLPTTQTLSFIPTPMTFNSTSTAPTPTLMPLTDSPSASNPYNNSLLPTPLNLIPKNRRYLSPLNPTTYAYVPSLY